MNSSNGRRAAWRVALLGLLGLVMGPMSLVVPSAPAAAVEARPEWGSVSAADGVLRASCRSYAYSYVITAPEDGEWDLNVTLVGPGGRDLWFGYLYEGANPDSGTATFRLCRSRTKPGRYRLRAVVSVQDGNEYVAGSLPTATFRLRKPR